MTITPWPHQVDGARWLSGRVRAVLADEQGMGKTVTSLMAAEASGMAGGLIVCANGKAQDWLEHAARLSGRASWIPRPSDRPIHDCARGLWTIAQLPVRGQVGAGSDPARGEDEGGGAHGPHSRRGPRGQESQDGGVLRPEEGLHPRPGP